MKRDTRFQLPLPSRFKRQAPSFEAGAKFRRAGPPAGQYKLIITGTYPCADESGLGLQPQSTQTGISNSKVVSACSQNSILPNSAAWSGYAVRACTHCVRCLAGYSRPILTSQVSFLQRLLHQPPLRSTLENSSRLIQANPASAHMTIVNLSSNLVSPRIVLMLFAPQHVLPLSVKMYEAMTLGIIFLHNAFSPTPPISIPATSSTPCGILFSTLQLSVLVALIT